MTWRVELQEKVPPTVATTDAGSLAARREDRVGALSPHSVVLRQPELKLRALALSVAMEPMFEFPRVLALLLLLLLLLRGAV